MSPGNRHLGDWTFMQVDGAFVHGHADLSRVQ